MLGFDIIDVVDLFVIGFLIVFYPYKGKTVPQGVLFKSTTFAVFFNVAL